MGNTKKPIDYSKLTPEELIAELEKEQTARAEAEAKLADAEKANDDALALNTELQKKVELANVAAADSPTVMVEHEGVTYKVLVSKFKVPAKDGGDLLEVEAKDLQENTEVLEHLVNIKSGILLKMEA